jgi:predicted MPP superfamily phosphohydrolase
MKTSLPAFRYCKWLAIALIIGLVPSSLGYMSWEGRSSEITVLSLEGAPEGIVFIADPHVREGNIEHIREMIQEINELRPSVVLIGGDFVYGEGDDLVLQEVWREIDAPVYAVLGNHDYQVGTDATSCYQKTLAARDLQLDSDHYDVSSFRDGSENLAFADALVSTLEQNGVHVLRNEYEEIEIGGKHLLIVGVDDGWAGMADPPDVPETDAYVIYMIHEPDFRANWDADLILAGHTHGGQFIPPGIDGIRPDGSVTVRGFELSGLFEKDGTVTYITRGMGTSNLPVELRMNVPPEIVIINPGTANLSGIT